MVKPSLLSLTSTTSIFGASIASFLHKPSSSPPPSSLFSTSIKPTKIHAKLGGGDGEVKKAEKKFITRDEEPEQ